jgi:hypothetical protein
MPEKPRSAFWAVAVFAVAALFVLLVALVANVPHSSEPAPEGSEAFAPPNDSQSPSTSPAFSAESSDLVFISKRGYISESGCPTVIGEVKNGGNASMKDILLTASFYCSSGKLIGAKEDLSAIISSYTEIPILAPGETSPFKIALSREQIAQLEHFDVDKLAKFKVDSEYTSTDELLYKQFELTQSRGELDSSTGQYTVKGTVKNIGNETVEQLKVVGTFYDNQTQIIDVISTYLVDTQIPGEEATFTLKEPDETIAQRIETYAVQAVGS